MRRQLAAYSPVSARALLGAAPAALGLRVDGADRLLSCLAARLGADGGLLCGSGTQALQLAITAARTLSGDESAVVALPAFTCYDVASAGVGAGGPVALYDLDARTLSPDVRSLERVLAGGAKVLVVPWAYGFAPAWGQVRALAQRHAAIVVEDAAQGHGASWRGRPAGSFGALSVLSFGRGKGWTGGRGGALLCRIPGVDLPSLARTSILGEVSNLAKSAAQWALGRPALYAIPAAIPGLALGETVYHPPQQPLALPRTAAALLRRTRGAAEREASARRRNARALLDAIAGIPGIRPIQPVNGAEPGYLRLPVLIDAPLPRGAARLGIGAGYPSPLSAVPALRPQVTGPERHRPGAESLVARLVTLPTHSLVTARDIAGIGAFLRAAVPRVATEPSLAWRRAIG